MLTIFHGRVKFSPKQDVAANGTPYVLLNISQRGNKDSAGNTIFNEFHVTVWDQFDLELARSLEKGDKITVSLERLKQGFRTEKSGRTVPYMSGNAVAGELVAEYTNKPSAGLFQYETAAEARREQYRQQAKAQAAPAPQAPQPQAPQPQAPQPAQVQAVPQPQAPQAPQPAQPQAPQAPQPAQVQAVPLPQAPQATAAPLEMGYEVPF